MAKYRAILEFEAESDGDAGYMATQFASATGWPLAELTRERVDVYWSKVKLDEPKLEAVAS